MEHTEYKNGDIAVGWLGGWMDDIAGWMDGWMGGWALGSNLKVAMEIH